MRESVKKDVYGFSVRCIKKGYEVPTCPITLGATTMEPSTTATQVSGYTISTVVNNSDEMAGITGQYVLCNKDGQPITLGSTTQAASISYAATVVDGKLQAFIPEDDITEYKIRC
jgi:hypothetical protein